jgi:tellurite methyltransferase
VEFITFRWRPLRDTKILKHSSLDPRTQFGPIDIYLFDQILKGRIAPGMRILDAGCGGGRNLVYLLREGYEVFGVDQDLQAITEVRHLAASLAPHLPLTNFDISTIEAMPFQHASFDVVISSAVLHFAQNDNHFRAMLNATWNAVKPGGTLFCRLASSIGLEKEVKKIKGRRFLLPDGSDRYLVDGTLLEKLTSQLNAELLDPIKTTIVQNQRSMTTWVLRKLRLN